MRLRDRPRGAGPLPGQRGSPALGAQGLLSLHPGGRPHARVARAPPRDRTGDPPPPGARARDGPDRPRQDQHPGGDRGHHQPRDLAPRHHGRRSGRVLAPAKAGDHHPARGRRAHPVVRGRLEGVSPRRPRRHRGGRASRHRDGAHGACRQRDGASRARHDEHSERRQDDRSRRRSLSARRSTAGANDARRRAPSHRGPAARPGGRRQGDGRSRRALAGIGRALEPHPRQQDVPDSQLAAARSGLRHLPARRVPRGARALGARVAHRRPRGRRKRRGSRGRDRGQGRGGPAGPAAGTIQERDLGGLLGKAGQIFGKRGA